MLNATTVLFVRMTFKSAAAVCFGCCLFEFRVSLSGIGDFWIGEWAGGAKWLAVSPSVESIIENSIKFSFNSPLVKDDFLVDFVLICGTATALLDIGVVDDLPLRCIDAISGCWCCCSGGWWWTSFVGNFVELVPLFKLWLLLLMLLLLLFIVGGCASVDGSPCSNRREKRRKKSNLFIYVLFELCLMVWLTIEILFV